LTPVAFLPLSSLTPRWSIFPFCVGNDAAHSLFFSVRGDSFLEVREADTVFFPLRRSAALFSPLLLGNFCRTDQIQAFLFLSGIFRGKRKHFPKMAVHPSPDQNIFCLRRRVGSLFRSGPPPFLFLGEKSGGFPRLRHIPLEHNVSSPSPCLETPFPS